MAGRNSVYGPSNATLFDPAAVKGTRKIYVGGGLSEIPPFSVAGFVNGVGESPGYPMSASVAIRHCVVEVGSAGGSSITFAILVNGVAVISHTASVSGTTSYAESLGLVADDIVSASITALSGSTLHNLLIVLRL